VLRRAGASSASHRADCAPGTRALARWRIGRKAVRRDVLKNVLLAIASVVAALIAFELLLAARPDLRTGHASPKFVFCQGDSQRYQQDAAFRKAEIPGSIYFENNGEGWSIHLNNERGFRDIFDSGDQHAIILGDSFTRGTSVQDHQTIPYLLDLWSPDVAFHSFATGGSGTADAYRAYQAIAQDWEHRLVILNYYLGNDLRNNLASDTALEADTEEVQLGEVRMASAPKRLLTRYHRLMRANSHVYNLAYTSAKIVTSGRKSDQLPQEQLALGAKITKGLLLALGRDAASHDADLLIVIIPSWNEIMDLGAEDDPGLQRRIIGEVAGELDNVYVRDLTADITARGARSIYGQVDKHFNPLGTYTAAKATYEWINRDWPRGPRTNQTAPPFDDDRWGVGRPDCALVDGYRERLLYPSAAPQEARTH
jgi:hypothetical protein